MFTNMNSTLDCSSHIADVNRGGFEIAAIAVSFCGVLLATSCNLLNFVVLPRMQNKFGENTRLCLLWLSFADFVGGVLCYGNRIVYLFDHSLLLNDRTVCAIASNSCTAFIMQSNLLLVVVSIDRFVAITMPLRYSTVLSKTRMKLLITVAIISGALGGSIRAVHSIFTDSCDYDPGASIFIKTPSMIIYLLLVFVIGMTIAILNIRLLAIARRHHRRMVQMHPRERDSHLKNAQNRVPNPDRSPKAVVTVAVIVGTFIFAWTPYSIGIFVALCTGYCLSDRVFFCMLLIAFSNHFLNAIICYCLHENYRSIVRRLIKCNHEIQPM